MSASLFRVFLYLLAIGFTIAFAAVVVPPLLQDGDVVGAFAAGFVNPYASGYALDIFFCWFVLAVWVVYEARVRKIRHGWLALVLGVVPGVATGFAFYLLLRLQHENRSLTGHEQGDNNTVNTVEGAVPAVEGVSP